MRTSTRKNCLNKISRKPRFEKYTLTESDGIQKGRYAQKTLDSNADSLDGDSSGIEEEDDLRQLGE